MDDPSLQRTELHTQLETKTLGLGELFTIALKFYRAHFGIFALFVLALYGPFSVVNVALRLALPRDTNATILFSSCLSLVGGLLTILVDLSIANIVDQALMGNNLSFQEALRRGYARWLYGVGTGFLGGLIIIGGSFLLIVPGIIFVTNYSFMYSAVALRGISGMTALNYSKRLVSGQWWRVFGVNLFILLCALGLVILVFISLVIVGTLTIVIGGNGAMGPVTVIIGAFENILFEFVLAFVTVMQVIFFLNTDYLRHLDSSEYAQAVLARAYAAEERNDFEYALRECDAALAINPNSAEAQNLRGIVLEALGRKPDALAAYERAKVIDPTFSDAQENSEELRQEIQALLPSSPKPLTPLERAYAAREQRDFALALRECDTALAIDSNSAQAHNLRGTALEALGRKSEALAAYRRAITLDASFSDAQKNWEALSAKMMKAQYK